MAALVPVLVAAEAAVRVLPLDRAVRLAGGRLAFGAPSAVPAGPGVPGPAVDADGWVDEWVTAGRRLADRWPARGRCLRRALLCCWVLRARDPVVRLGVRRDHGRWVVHAWVEVHGRALEAGTDAFRGLRVGGVPG